jgi:Zn-dependent protease
MAPVAGGGRSVGLVGAEIAISVVPLVVAIVLHEVAHGAVAYGLGDPTAARAGRLSLNPLRHIDPFGTIVLPGLLLLAPVLFGTRPFVFGWARPVPVDVRLLHHPRRDAVLVALAGPLTNLVLAAASALLLGWLPADRAGGGATVLQHLAIASLSVNCVLAVFNLLPIPPLDGSRVLSAFLGPAQAGLMRTLEQVGMVVLLLVVMQGNLVGRLVRPLIMFLLRLAG